MKFVAIVFVLLCASCAHYYEIPIDAPIHNPEGFLKEANGLRSCVAVDTVNGWIRFKGVKE